MATGTTSSSSQISDVSGYCVFGELRFGSNGNVNGDPEVEAGAVNQTPSSARRQWDNNMNDGLSAGPFSVVFTAEAGGGANAVKWSVQDANPSPLTYSGATYGAITRVRLRAAVQTTALVDWTSVLVRFYKNGRLSDSYPTNGAPTAGPLVDTRGGSLPVTAEQILEITPVAGTNTKVIITGTVTLAAPQGVTPDVNDLFAQVFVDTATCT
jgi:hypothetical protein